MTEQEWLNCTDPDPMLRLIRGRMTDRKNRLFAVACCRDIAARFSHPQFHYAVEVAERFADGRASSEELDAAADAVQQARFEARLPLGDSSALKAAAETCWDSFMVVQNTSSSAAYAFAGYACVYTPDSQSLQRMAVREAKRRDQAVLLRCITTNLFRLVSVNSSWLTTTAVALAQQMYESREFASMPILADALQDAGCDNADILDHCRSDGPHVRGCWVVDLLLGKE